ncbi:hypothetical protein XELAEV_18026189mg [Xenopus laevis]|uniref:Uncharacterized protein n=1 Tax=Xenopus laevis TaxID=8355 RepID=A0A974CVL3_XENLA|nr:hypothetical protein XELAEV_18026189mg [Xenopus laevis]
MPLARAAIVIGTGFAARWDISANTRADLLPGIKASSGNNMAPLQKNARQSHMISDLLALLPITNIQQIDI